MNERLSKLLPVLIHHQSFFLDFHTFGCPCYVLGHRLQSGLGHIPKWEPRSWMGIYVGRSFACFECWFDSESTHGACLAVKLICCMMGPSIVSLLWRNLVWHQLRPLTIKRPYSNLIKSSLSKLWYMRLTITKRESIRLSLDFVIYQMVPKLSWLSGVLSKRVILMAP